MSYLKSEGADKNPPKLQIPYYVFPSPRSESKLQIQFSKQEKNFWFLFFWTKCLMRREKTSLLLAKNSIITPRKTKVLKQFQFTWSFLFLKMNWRNWFAKWVKKSTGGTLPEIIVTFRSFNENRETQYTEICFFFFLSFFKKL